MARKPPVTPHCLVRDLDSKQYAIIPIYVGREEDELIDRVMEVQKSRHDRVRLQGCTENRDLIEQGLVREGYVRVAHVDLILGPPTFRRR